MDDSKSEMSRSIGDSIKSSFNDSNKTNQSMLNREESDKNDSLNIMKGEEAKNPETHDVNYGLGTLDSFVKLKATTKNIPVHKLMSELEKETEYTKNILIEGKKERRILESKLVTSENNATVCAQNLLTKVIHDLNLFTHDMRKMIKQNMDVTTQISKELYDLTVEMKKLNKDYEGINTLVTEVEENVGIIDYWNW